MNKDGTIKANDSFQNLVKSGEIKIDSKNEQIDRIRQKSEKPSDKSASSSTWKVSEEESPSNYSWKVFLEYIQNVGYMWAVLYVMLTVAEHALYNYGDVMLSQFVSKFDEEEPDSLTERRFIYRYCGIAVVTSITIALCNFVSQFSTRSAHARLHDGLLQSVLRAPTAFFDETPVGRVIDRFSGQFGAIEDGMEGSIQWIFRTLVWVACCFAMIARSSRLFLLAFIPLGVLAYFAKIFFIPAYQKSVHLRSKVSPLVFSKFSNVVAGASVIRAFKDEQRYFENYIKVLDNGLKTSHLVSTIEHWLWVRVQFVGNVFVLAISIFGKLLEK